MSNDFFADDANAFTPLDRGTGKQSRQLTGWMVFGLIVAFFAVIFGVNAYMAHMAISTFGGVETESSYHAGQTFERDVAMTKAQDQQHWQVDVNVTTAADGGASSTLSRATLLARRLPASPRPRCLRGPPTGALIATSPSARARPAASAAMWRSRPASGIW
jgi:hypothetical protein